MPFLKRPLLALLPLARLVSPGLLAVLFAAALLLAGCQPALSVSPGSLDASFNSPRGNLTFNHAANLQDRGVEVAVQPDGKLVVLGYSHTGKDEDLFLARYLPDGRPDAAFGKGGYVLYDGGGHDRGLGLALQADGRIVAAGFTYAGGQRDVLVVRFNPDGMPDGAFGKGGAVTYSSPGAATDIGFGAAFRPDGRIIVVGETARDGQQDALVLCFNPDGSLDGRFGAGGVYRYGGAAGKLDRAFAAAVQPDGKILVTGGSVVNGKDDVLLFRLSLEGTPDPAFGRGGLVLYSGAGDNPDYGNWVSLQPDGKIVVSGAETRGSAFDLLVLRFNADGTPDGAFGKGGAVVHGDAGDGNDYGYGHVVQRDGKIVVAGFARRSVSDDVLLVRFDGAGRLDPSFGGGGEVLWNGAAAGTDYAQGVALQPDGRLVVAGFSQGADGEDLLLMRFLP